MTQNEKANIYTEWKGIARTARTGFLASQIKYLARLQQDFISMNGCSSMRIRLHQKAFYDELVRRGDIVLDEYGEVVSMSLEVAHAQ